MRKGMVTGLVMAGVVMAGGAMAMGEAGAQALKVSGSQAGVVPAAVSGTVSGTLAAAVKTPAQVLAVGPDDRVEGSMMAPVTVVEYGSFTCSHCADFSKETYPQVKKDWIDTGKVRYVLRAMPWDNMALGMAKVARCAPAEQYYPLTKTFYAQQMKILGGKDPLAEIKNVARMAGMSEAQVDACIKDPDVHASVNRVKDDAFNILQVRGTPTLFVNGAVVNGAVPYKDLKKVLEAEYAKKR
jgi:protein-disulfide isomerase